MKVSNPTSDHRAVLDAMAVVVALAFLAMMSFFVIKLVSLFEKLYIPF